MTEGANNSSVDANKKSFWATTQGVLTTLVAVVTAITGLLAVLNECGGPGSTTSTGSPPSLTVQAALLGPDEQRPFADHVVTVRLKADEDFLAQVDHVTYLLPPSFGGPNEYTSSSPDDGYEFTFGASGSFILQAKVHLKDGNPRDLVQEIRL